MLILSVRMSLYNYLRYLCVLCCVGVCVCVCECVRCPCPLIAVPTARTDVKCGGRSEVSLKWLMVHGHVNCLTVCCIHSPLSVASLVIRRPSFSLQLMCCYCSLNRLEPLFCLAFLQRKRQKTRAFIAACCARCSIWCDTWPRKITRTTNSSSSSSNNNNNWCNKASKCSTWCPVFYLPCKLKSNTCCLIKKNSSLQRIFHTTRWIWLVKPNWLSVSQCFWINEREKSYDSRLQNICTLSMQKYFVIFHVRIVLLKSWTHKIYTI